MESIKFGDIWATLSKIDCSGHTETKRTGFTELTYLSWAWAWAELMNHYPEAEYSVREWDGSPWLDDPALGLIVMTEVNIGGNVRRMWLPVMDGANNAMKDEPYSYTVKGRDGSEIEKKVAAADMTAVNKAIMRCLVKNLAMFGLGLNIYAGEDLPVGETCAGARPAQAGCGGGVVSARPAQAGCGGGGGGARPAQAGGTAEKAAAAASAGSEAARRANAPAKAREAWTAFKALPAVKGLGEGERTAMWTMTLKTETGKTEAAKLTDEEWDRVINRISVDACM